ncbi:MAG TPA: hypothetical protein VFO09_00690 [Methyloceanibacter sp.]|nr:hypothetical protein [Methyloceanibacter sp.]
MPGRVALSPEKAEAAWTLQAQTVAGKLGLDPEQTTHVVAAYSSSRKGQQAAANEIRTKLRQQARDAAEADGGQGDRRAIMAEMQKAIEELNKAEREKFVQELAKSLDTEQTRKTAASLGTFNAQWDVMVDTLAGFNLEAEKLNQALAATESYTLATHQARSYGEDDPSSMRTAMQEARANLQDAVKPLLSEEQFGQFQRTLGRGRGGPGAPGGRGEGGQGGGRGGRGGGQGGGAGGQGGGQGGGQEDGQGGVN